MSEQFPIHLQKFITEHFNSVEQLEILLILRNSPQQAFSISRLNEFVRSNEVSIRARLVHLLGSGLVKVDPSAEGAYQYAANPEKDNLMAEVANAYLVKRYGVINLIYSGKSNAIESFAGAFDLRKDKKNG